AFDPFKQVSLLHRREVIWKWTMESCAVCCLLEAHRRISLESPDEINLHTGPFDERFRDDLRLVR
ncbi:hypothetical protein N9028_00720, partial [bacterium]|nr:hypothetical protein [bacterium]